jgi:hypothetical protein
MAACLIFGCVEAFLLSVSSAKIFNSFSVDMGLAQSRIESASGNSFRDGLLRKF